MLFLSEAIFVVRVSSSCSHNGCKCSQMNNTRVVQKEGGIKSRRVADLCLSERILLIDIVNGFSVSKYHCKSRLKPDGPPCNHYSNSICQIIKRHVLCLSLVRRMTHSIDAHVTLTHRKFDGGQRRQAWLINTGHTHLSVCSGPWIIRTDNMQIATRMANNWKENNKMAKNSTRGWTETIKSTQRNLITK